MKSISIIFIILLVALLLYGCGIHNPEETEGELRLETVQTKEDKRGQKEIENDKEEKPSVMKNGISVDELSFSRV